MEEKKKRGRKPKIVKIENEEKLEELDKDPIKKKRGRKKKWESDDNNNYYTSSQSGDFLKFNNTNNVEKDLKDFNTNNLCFGNLKIQVLRKETEQKNLNDFFKKEDECDLYISDDDYATDTSKNISYKNIKGSKTIKLYKTENEEKIVKKDIRCFYCHHKFDTKQFFLPIDYCPKLDRFKITGNFCSPNCVKSYCLKSKTFENKLYLVGFFYRRLFGQDFNIKPAPDIYLLKEYGGNMTIEEFRKSFYNNEKYILSNINSKIINII